MLRNKTLAADYLYGLPAIKKIIFYILLYKGASEKFTPVSQLWINSPPLKVKHARAGFPLAESAVRSMRIPYFLVGNSISIDLSILKVIVLPANE